MKTIKIRVKIKTILIFGILICVVMLPFFMQSFTYMMMGKIYENFDKDKADAYYARSIVRKGIGSVESALSRIDDVMGNRFHYCSLYYASKGSKGSSGVYLEEDSLNQINKEYNTIVSNGKNDKVAVYEMKIAVANFHSGSTSFALEILKNLDYIKDKKLIELKNLHMAAMYLASGRNGEGFETLSRNVFSSYKEAADFLLAYYYYVIGDVENYYKYKWENERLPYYDLGKVEESYEDLVEPLYGFFELQEAFDRLEQIKTSAVKSENSLSGKIISPTGRTAPVFISLVPEGRNMGWSSSDIMGVDAVAAAMTDENGRYHVNNIPNGRYNLYITTFMNSVLGASLSFGEMQVIEFDGNTQVEEENIHITPIKIEAQAVVKDSRIFVSAENVPKAERYKVYLKQRVKTGGGNYTRILFESGKVPLPEASFTIEDQVYLQAGMSRSSGSGPNPLSYLPPFYGEKEYVVTVTGYDEEDNVIFSTDDMGGFGRYEDEYCSSILKFTETNEADQKLIDGDFAGAVPLYEKYAKEGDQYAMAILAALYTEGYIYDSVEDNWEEYGGKDFQKAAYYLEKLLTYDPDDEQILSSLGRCYQQLGQFDRAIEYYKRVEPVNGYPTSQIGKIYWNMGETRKAQVYLQKAFDQEPSFEQLLFVNILLNDREKIKDTSEHIKENSNSNNYRSACAYYLKTDVSQYEQFFGLVRDGKVTEAKAYLTDMPDDLSKFYTLMLILLEDTEEKEKYAEYFKVYDEMNDGPLKDMFIPQIRMRDIAKR